ncbi:MAG: two component transcriptional regulator, winged helix family [Solirubrobacterales bacterium]|jgi:DNA-binding response OmpR family regulator|nr:two component transcriptional regulator, winged helix family [Solirubrobacterales bacterium]
MTTTSLSGPVRATTDEPRPSGQGPTPIRLAVVDGDSAFLHVLAKRLHALGWEHRVFPGGVPVEELVALRVGAVVLDLGVLGPHGWSYLEQLAHELPNLPVLVCAGPSTVAQRVRGLRLGADDWLNKPCHPEELIARVEAVVRRRRRAEAPAQQPAIGVGEVTIRPDQFQAFVDERSIDLTRREFELIHLLADARGRVLQREEIYQRVWGYAMAHGDRSVDVFVRKLRQKLEKASPEWRYIHTHFGIGYRFAPEPVEAGESPVLESMAVDAAEPGASPSEVTTGQVPSAPAHEVVV